MAINTVAQTLFHKQRPIKGSIQSIANANRPVSIYKISSVQPGHENVFEIANVACIGSPLVTLLL